MNENKVPCGGFKVDPTYFRVYKGQLELDASFIDTYGFMRGYCAYLVEHVDESAAYDKWQMEPSEIENVIFNIKSGNPVFAEIRTYLGPGQYAYSTGNLCYYKEGKKLIFSCPYSEGVTFSIKFYDVNINTGIATVKTKQLS